ncbi:MAG: rhodanese-like domain-containing protein [Proteobacteria bacterium]|nr:rhodanese-like domain-containing protein [Pseudomonadota bacterium]
MTRAWWQFIVSALAVVFLLAGSGGAQETANPPPLVDETWLAENSAAQNVVMLDLRSREEFSRGRLKGSVFADYPERWRPIGRSGRRGLLGRAAFATLAGELGIDNASHVILIHAGRTANDAASATDIFLSFRLQSHRRVSILNARPRAAADAGIEIERGEPVARPPKTFGAVPTTGFLAGGRKAVRESIGAAPLVDMRRDTQFIGLEKPGDVSEPGTIPTARNLAGRWIFDETVGRFRDTDTLRQVFAFSRIPLDKKAIFFGNNSALGTLGWFVSRELLGNSEARIYAGGMGDWMSASAEEAPRVVRYIQSLEAAPVRRN